MTLGKMVAEIAIVKPNQYPTDIIVGWINEVENMVIEQIHNRRKWDEIDFDGYDFDTDEETELQVPDIFKDLYIHYVSAKIDYSNREFGGYNNSKAMFDDSFQEYAAYCKRTYDPKPLKKMRGF